MMMRENEPKNYEAYLYKITVHKTISDKFFENNQKIFSFIYIDGCHELDYIKRDMVNSFKVLKKDGIMWMDDYGGGNAPNLCKIPMNNFLEEYKGKYTIIHKNYQLAIKKN